MASATRAPAVCIVMLCLPYLIRNLESMAISLPMSKSLHRTGISNYLLPLFGYVINAATISDNGIQFRSGNVLQKDIPFKSITGIKVTSWLIGSRFRLRCDGGRDVNIVGVDGGNARTFANSVETAWKYFLRRLLDGRRGHLLSIANRLVASENPTQYLAASDGTELLQDAQTSIDDIPSMVPDEVLAEDEHDAIRLIRSFLSSPSKFRDKTNETFVEVEIVRHKNFFDSIESNSLTSEQRTAVVTDENATLILAAAGSGKTSVIVSKANYLVETKLRSAEEILMLSFGRDAANEMAERVNRRTGHNVEATTFHALGLTIIGQSENRKPALAAHADDDKQLLKLLRDILKSLIDQDKRFEDTMRRWFAEFFAPYRSEFDFKKLSEYYQYIRAYEFRTLQGEKVKSFEECEIANFLYLNGIAYEYEPDYEHDTSSSERRVYTPDFRLTDSGIYIEHFGVGKEVGPDGRERLVTAPYIDKDRYLQDMQWKINLHHRFQTRLIQTFSYEKSAGRLATNLKDKLGHAGVEASRIPTDDFFKKLIELGQIDPFSKLIATFLHHFKANKLDRFQCVVKAGTGTTKNRNFAFLDVFLPVFDAYQKSLGSRIDFEDMIIRAIIHVEKGRYQSPYQHLLVDEFQDISFGRARLLKALLRQHPDSRLFAVGDDWQSIYRFAGSDLSIMRNFGKTFGREFDGREGVQATVDLGRTFRCVDKITEPATRFILKNDRQLNKQVQPAGKTKSPAVRVVFSGFDDSLGVVRNILDDINAKESDTRQSVRLLGRYNHLKPDDLSDLIEEYPDIDLGFLSIHRSKGLESDHIIVLGMDSGKWGFPSEIVDDPVLIMVVPESEEFPNAEERRLFYVALTRAKKSVHLVTNSSHPSSFVDELIEGDEYDIEIIGDLPYANGRCAKCSGRMLRKQGNDKPYFVCEFGKLCGNRSPVCPECGDGLPARREGADRVMTCSCGAEHPVCNECGEGWLIERQGPYGTFMGCSRYPDCRGAHRLYAAVQK